MEKSNPKKDIPKRNQPSSYDQLHVLEDQRQLVMIDQVKSAFPCYLGCHEYNKLLHSYAKSLSKTIQNGLDEDESRKYLKKNLETINSNFNTAMNVEMPNNSHQKNWQNQVYKVVTNLSPLTPSAQREIVKQTMRYKELRDKNEMTPEAHKEIIGRYEHLLVQNLPPNSRQVKVQEELYPSSRFRDPLDGSLGQQPQGSDDIFNFDKKLPKKQPQEPPEPRKQAFRTPLQDEGDEERKESDVLGPNHMSSQAIGGQNLQAQQDGINNSMQNHNNNRIIYNIQSNYYVKDFNINLYIINCNCSQVSSHKQFNSQQDCPS
ncbi:hypothetical protein OXYTRIMIC_630 [Oxytricha trifallax]|uniref:Uncharacterized protein n=1 Tax=Oxytricha trifallax TaxID=1172189 RepID=A0A073ICF2_9SPIT|nr:hypothetical protein OXYTRIMIC_630 [Oxytricha trifallax]